ncbi:MAG: hypothetical protein ABEJ89_03905 [Haloarculaceae archaeon]
MPEEGRSPRANLIEALEVRRNVRRGLVVGVVVAVAVYVFFVVIPGTYRSQYLYVALAFVLAMSVAGLAAAVFTARRAFRMARQSEPVSRESQ